MDSQAVDRLRQTGLSFELIEGNLEVSPVEKVTTDHRRTIAQHRGEIVKVLRKELFDRLREAAERGDPFAPISDEHPASEVQLQRIRELRRREEVPDQIAEDVQAKIRSGLSETEARRLIYELGRRIREHDERTSQDPALRGGVCEECGRTIGPSATICGRCRRIWEGLPVRAESMSTHRGGPPVE